MYSLDYIRSSAKEQARAAAKQKREPIVLFSADTAYEDLRRAPYLGDYCPKGWRPVSPEWKVALVERGVRAKALFDGNGRSAGLWVFADATGVGGADEPALCTDELKLLASGLVEIAAERGAVVGVSIVEIGQFQVHLAVFEKEVKA